MKWICSNTYVILVFRWIFCLFLYSCLGAMGCGKGALSPLWKAHVWVEDTTRPPTLLLTQAERWELLHLRYSLKINNLFVLVVSFDNLYPHFSVPSGNFVGWWDVCIKIFSDLVRKHTVIHYTTRCLSPFYAHRSTGTCEVFYLVILMDIGGAIGATSPVY